jgi:hypothetical protein
MGLQGQVSNFCPRGAAILFRSFLGAILFCSYVGMQAERSRLCETLLIWIWLALSSSFHSSVRFLLWPRVLAYLRVSRYPNPGQRLTDWLPVSATEVARIWFQWRRVLLLLTHNVVDVVLCATRWLEKQRRSGGRAAWTMPEKDGADLHRFVGSGAGLPSITSTSYRTTDRITLETEIAQQAPWRREDSPRLSGSVLL